MDMSTHTTMSMDMPTSTSSSMSMSTGMSDMSMGMGGCKISMTWNWYTVGACFISKQWQITSSGMFAGSCIGVILLVVSLEFLRRMQREFDALLQRRDQARSTKQIIDERASSLSQSANVNPDSDRNNHVKTMTNVSVTAEPTLTRSTLRHSSKVALLRRQAARAFLHTLQFAVAYFVMLLAMYYNGYIIICILIGAFLGSFIFSWDQLLAEEKKKNEAADVTGCCG